MGQQFHFLGQQCRRGVAKKKPGRTSGFHHGPARLNNEPGTNLLSHSCTIIGPGCLTTVVGMETGVANQVLAPGIRILSEQPHDLCFHTARSLRTDELDASKARKSHSKYVIEVLT